MSETTSTAKRRGGLVCKCGNRKSFYSVVCNECKAQRPPVVDKTFFLDGVFCRLIPLTRGEYALVDALDYDSLMDYKWYAKWSKPMNSYYASTVVKTPSGKWKHLSMHRLILGITAAELEGDHINGDTLNNTRRNLRPASGPQNQANCKVRTDNTSGYRGVCWHVRFGKWHAKISVNGKRIHLGYFATAQEAALARDAAARERFGEFARLNFPKE